MSRKSTLEILLNNKDKRELQKNFKLSETQEEYYTNTSSNNCEFALNDPQISGLQSVREDGCSARSTSEREVPSNAVYLCVSPVFTEFMSVAKKEFSEKEFSSEGGQTLTTNTQEIRNSSDENARENICILQKEMEDPEDQGLSEFSEDHKLSIMSLTQERSSSVNRELEKQGKISNEDHESLENHKQTNKNSRKKVFTFVRPSPQRRAGSCSSMHSPTSISNTRKLAFLAKSNFKELVSASEPYLRDSNRLALSALESEVSLLKTSCTEPLSKRHGRVYEGGRLLFCKSSWKRSVDSFLIPQESLRCHETEETCGTNFNLRSIETIKRPPADHRGVSDHHNTNNYNYHVSNESIQKNTNADAVKRNVKIAGRFLERQKAFEEDEILKDLTRLGVNSDEQSQGFLNDCAERYPDRRLSAEEDGKFAMQRCSDMADHQQPPLQLSDFKHDENTLDKHGSKMLSLPYLDVNDSKVGNLGREFEIQTTDKPVFFNSTREEAATELESKRENNMENISDETLRKFLEDSASRKQNEIENIFSTLPNKRPSNSTPTLYVNQHHVTSELLSLRSLKQPDDVTQITEMDQKPVEQPQSPRKRNRVKLALATSHTGIYITGDSLDDPSSDSQTGGCSFDKCPSWVCDHAADSSFLTPYYQPLTTSNEDKTKNLVSFQKRRASPSPITLAPERQISNSSEKDSFNSSSPQSKTSGYSVQDSGFEASGRHSTALLSPSFREISKAMTSHLGTSTSGEVYSSEEYFPYLIEDRATSPTLNDNKRRKNPELLPRGKYTPELLSPIFPRAASHEETGSPKPKSHLFRFSNSSDGDSGLETPRSAASLSPHVQRMSQSSSRHALRSSRYSSQSKYSSKSSDRTGTSSLKLPNQNEDHNGSFLSFLSPKKFFNGRKNSDGGRSCASRTSRKQPSDIPDDEKIILINVSGRKFKLHEYFTSVYPETLLGNTRRNKFYDRSKEEYFFDKDPDVFRHIWNFYYTGKLHFPKEECVSHFIDEISFFGVSDEYLCACCWEDEFEPAAEKLEKIRKEIQMREQELLMKTRKMPKDASLKEKLWLTTKDPVISSPAKVFYFFSILSILISTVANITETIPCMSSANLCKENNREVYFYIDSVCVAFFTFEYLLKLISAPNRLLFARKFMSIIDLLAVLPYYCHILLRFIFGTTAISGIDFLEILRILRIVRVFKLLKNSRRLQALVYTFKSSTTELGLIVFIYSILVTVFASMIYYAEMQDNPKYSSIPESMWYAVITTTTTGYGDIVPITIFGKLIGCACCLMGVLVVALPVPILQIRQ